MPAYEAARDLVENAIRDPRRNLKNKPSHKKYSEIMADLMGLAGMAAMSGLLTPDDQEQAVAPHVQFCDWLNQIATQWEVLLSRQSPFSQWLARQAAAQQEAYQQVVRAAKQQGHTMPPPPPLIAMFRQMPTLAKRIKSIIRQSLPELITAVGEAKDAEAAAQLVWAACRQIDMTLVSDAFQLMQFVQQERQRLCSAVANGVTDSFVQSIVDCIFNEIYLAVHCQMLASALIALLTPLEPMRPMVDLMGRMRADLTEIVAIYQSIFESKRRTALREAEATALSSQIVQMIFEMSGIQFKATENALMYCIEQTTALKQGAEACAVRMRALCSETHEMIISTLRFKTIAVDLKKANRGAVTQHHATGAVMAAINEQLAIEQATSSVAMLQIGPIRLQLVMLMTELEDTLDIWREAVQWFKPYADQAKESFIVEQMLKKAESIFSVLSAVSVEADKATKEKNADQMTAITTAAAHSIADCLSDSSIDDFSNTIKTVRQRIAGDDFTCSTEEAMLCVRYEVQVVMLWHAFVMRLLDFVKLSQPALPQHISDLASRTLASRKCVRNIIESYERYARDIECRWPQGGGSWATPSFPLLPQIAKEALDAIWAKTEASHYLVWTTMRTFPHDLSADDAAVSKVLGRVESISQIDQRVAELVATSAIERVLPAVSQSILSSLLTLPVYVDLREMVIEEIVLLCRALKIDDFMLTKTAKGKANIAVQHVQSRANRILSGARPPLTAVSGDFRHLIDHVDHAAILSEKLKELLCIIELDAVQHGARNNPLLKKISDALHHVKRVIDSIDSTITLLKNAEKIKSLLYIAQMVQLINKIEQVLPPVQFLVEFLLNEQVSAMQDLHKCGYKEVVERTLSAAAWTLIAVHVKQIQREINTVLLVMPSKEIKHAAEVDPCIARPVTASLGPQVALAVSESSLTTVLALPIHNEIEQEAIRQKVIEKMGPLYRIAEEGSLPAVIREAETVVQLMPFKINQILSNERNQVYQEDLPQAATHPLVMLSVALKGLAELSALGIQAIHEWHHDNLVSDEVSNALRDVQRAIEYLDEERAGLSDVRDIKTLQSREQIKHMIEGVYERMPTAASPHAKTRPFLAVDCLVEFLSEAYVLATNAIPHCRRDNVIAYTLEAVARGAMVAGAQRIQQRIQQAIVATVSALSPASSPSSRRASFSLGHFQPPTPGAVANRAKGATGSPMTGRRRNAGGGW